MEGDMANLASERAKRVQDYLLESGKVQSERVFLTQPASGRAHTNGHRVFLQLR